MNKPDLTAGSRIGNSVKASPVEATASTPTGAGTDEGDATFPRPLTAQTVFLSGIFTLAVITALYLAQAVLLPVVLAIVLKLLFQPLMRYADRFHIPRPLSALLAMVILVFALTGAVTALSGSAGAWFSNLPQGMARLEQKLAFLHEPINVLRHLDKTIDHVLTGNIDSQPAPEGGQPSTDQGYHMSLPGALLAGTGAILDVSLCTLLLLFFLLSSGDTFLRRLVEVLPRFKDKRQAVDISAQIERDIGAYLLTVSAMNLCVGFATGLGMYLCGLGDPVLWGVIAFILNYVPILGPIAGVALFILVGFMSLDEIWAACLPAVIYLGIHVVEGEILTPNLLAKRLTLNPVLVVVSLIFWYWLWGVAGAFLAVPLLAITKIIFSRFRPLAPLGHFLGGSL
jgi:predicted PurR-regulated permease PerM